MSRPSAPGRRPRRRALARGAAPALAAALLAALPPATPRPAAAAEWRAEPSLGQTFFYDDNVGFTEEGEEGSPGSTSAARLVLGGRNRALDLSLSSEFRFTRYFDVPKLDTNDQFLRGAAGWTGRRSRLELDGAFIRDTTGDDVTDADGTREQANERRVTSSVEPSFTYNLTPTQSLRLDGGVSRRVYPNIDGADEDGLASGTSTVFQTSGTTILSDGFDPGSATRQQDYWRYTAGLTWLQQLTPRSTVGVAGSALELAQARQDLSLVALQGVVTHQLTPRLRVDARAGPSLVRTETREQEGAQSFVFERDPSTGLFDVASRTSFTKSTDSSVDAGYLVDAGVVWDILRGVKPGEPRTTAELRVSHSVEPSGSSGEAVNRDELSLDLEHRAAPRLRLFATGSFNRDDNVSSGTNSSSSKSVRLEPGLGWEVAEDLELSLSYRLRYKAFGGDDGDDIVSNAVLLRLGLRLPELRRSW